MIQFIAEDKITSKLKVLKDISTFTADEFEKYNVYSTSIVSGDDFEKFKIQLQVRFLQEQSRLMMEQQEKISQQLAKLTGTNVVAPKPNTVQAVASNAPVTVPATDNISETKIMNVKTKTLFTRAELYAEFLHFKEAVERNIPEVTLVEFDVNIGFTVIVTEIVPNIPKMLPNGIPVRQKVE